jgi:hypothetical protein
MTLSRKVTAGVAGLAAAVVVGTAGVAAATAPDASPAPSATPSGSPTAPDGRDRDGHRGHRAGHRLFRGLYGEWVARGERDGTYVTVLGVRGEVTAVGATSVTIKAEDGFSATFAVGADTRVRGRDVDAIGDVKVGDRAAAVGPKSGDTVTARVVLVRGK